MLARARKVPRGGPAPWWLPVFFLFTLAVGVYAAEQPQRGFLHYLLFLVLPLSGLAGSMSGLALRSWQGSKLVGSRSVTVALGSLIAVVALAPPILIRLTEGNVFQKYVYGETQTSMIPSEVSRAIRKSVRPGDRMAVWGWMPQYFVITHAIMGTRDSIGQFQIENGPARPYYRERYLSDMQRNRPLYFIDAVSPISFAFTDRATQGLESFPELNQFVHRAYHLVIEVDGIRLFERNT